MTLLKALSDLEVWGLSTLLSFTLPAWCVPAQPILGSVGISTSLLGSGTWVGLAGGPRSLALFLLHLAAFMQWGPSCCTDRCRMCRLGEFSSVSQSSPSLYDPRDCSTPGLPVHHQLPELTQTMSIESVMPSSHPILCRPLLLLPSVFPSIRVFSKESVLHIRWPKHWSFSFSISPSKECSGLIS